MELRPPYKEVTDHHDGSGAVNDDIRIFVRDEPGPGGAHHDYEISVPKLTANVFTQAGYVRFIKGPRNEPGSVPGATQEALLAIVIDRLRDFQAGPFACEENQIALEATQLALNTLKNRTRDRMARGVLGTTTK